MEERTEKRQTQPASLGRTLRIHAMKVWTDCFLAWRYFKPKRSAVSVITLISVIGVILGVAVLIVVLAVMTGFTDLAKSKLLETGSHAQIRKAGVEVNDSARSPEENAASRRKIGVLFEDETDDIVKLGTEIDPKAKALPVLLSPVLLQVNGTYNPKALVAFDPTKADTSAFDLEKMVKKGKLSLDIHEIGISDVIAEEFGLTVGSKVLLHSPTRLAGLVEQDKKTGKYKASKKAEYYLPAEYVVSFIFSFDKYDFDRQFMFLSLDNADDLFKLDPGCATHVYVWVDDPFHMDNFLDDLRGSLSKRHPDLAVLSWKDLNEKYLGVLAVEKNMMFFLLAFIVLVAAFSIANTLITTVIQKTKEIGLLKSMGADSFSIMRIFILQGLFVGLIGTAGGVFLGWLVVLRRMDILYAMRAITGQEIFPKELYLFNELPAHIVWSDVALISVISILLCTCGALVPAIRAAHLDPAKALRYE